MTFMFFNPLEEGMAIYSSILAREAYGQREPVGLGEGVRYSP